MENIILIDFPKADEWEFKKELNKKTNLEWKEIEFVSNNIRKNKIDNIVRYLKYIYFPFKIFRNRKKYKNIIAWQQFYGILFAFYSRLFHVKKHNKLIVMTFIYKPKKGFKGKIYYKFVKYAIESKYIDKLVCFSKKECEEYPTIFNVDKSKFEYCKLGIKTIQVKDDNTISNRILSCGRSNRDYKFLYETLNQSKYELDIISDECKLTNTKNITIYNNIYGQEYFEMLKKSYIVVIPLENKDISAGQLVILQAMQLGKPVICTESNTAIDYIQDGENGFIVEKDKDKLLQKIEILYKDKELYRQISNNEIECFKNNYSITALGMQISQIFKKL